MFNLCNFLVMNDYLYDVKVEVFDFLVNDFKLVWGRIFCGKGMNERR